MITVRQRRRQFGDDRHVAALAALTFIDQDHQLVEEEVLDFNVGEPRDARQSGTAS
jgi:hypothetical protein